MSKTDNQAILQAIKSAESSLKMARQLLSGARVENERKDLSRLNYIDGIFDGSHMVDASGKKYEVNANYATKSLLVHGDKLRAYDENGKYWFKQVDKTPREKISGMLTQKAGVWHVVTADGSYKVSQNAVEFLNLKVNDDVDVFIPKNNKKAPFATLDFVKKHIRDGQSKVKEMPTEQKVEPKDTVKDSDAEQKVEAIESKAEAKKPAKKEEKISDKQETADKKEEKPKARSQKPKTVVASSKKEETKKEQKKTESKKEEVKSLEPVVEKVVLEEDDLR